jgi:hypothetical protein
MPQKHRARNFFCRQKCRRSAASRPKFACSEGGVTRPVKAAAVSRPRVQFSVLILVGCWAKATTESSQRQIATLSQTSCMGTSDSVDYSCYGGPKCGESTPDPRLHGTNGTNDTTKTEQSVVATAHVKLSGPSSSPNSSPFPRIPLLQSFALLSLAFGSSLLIPLSKLTASGITSPSRWAKRRDPARSTDRPKGRQAGKKVHRPNEAGIVVLWSPSLSSSSRPRSHLHPLACPISPRVSPPTQTTRIHTPQASSVVRRRRHWERTRQARD